MAQLAPPTTRTATIAGLCWLGFAAIAVAVTRGWTQQLDEAILIALRRGPAALNGPFIAITDMGSGTLRFVVMTTGCAVLLVLRQWRGVAFLVLAALPDRLIVSNMKYLFGRERPSVVAHLVDAGGFSFPSSHAFGGTTLYLALALAVAPLIAPVRRHPMITPALIIGGLLIGALISFSRVWLGVHYPSDVVAGWLAAIGWVLVWHFIVMRTAPSENGIAP